MKFKWIEISPGHYKLVPPEDPRPAIKLKEGIGGKPFLKFSPPWGKYEERMWSSDKKVSMQQTDRFIDERNHSMKTDARAKNWEEGRKKEWARNKPYWRKKLVSK